MKTVKDYLKHPKKFLNALLGRPNPVEIPEGQVTYQGNPTSPEASLGAQPHVDNSTKNVSPDDPLHQDLAKASSLIKTISAKLPKVALPIVPKTETPQDPQISQVSEIIKPNKVKKLIPLIIGLVILLVLVLVGFFAYSYIAKLRAPKENPIVVTNPSPTPIEQEQTQPSIYANDPDILKLQEDINVLDREVVGAQLRESTLNAPVLDFNISF